MISKEIATVYEKWCNGDPISDDELKNVIPCIQNVVAFLHDMPDRFLFARKELYSFLEGMKGFREARKK